MGQTTDANELKDLSSRMKFQLKQTWLHSRDLLAPQLTAKWKREEVLWTGIYIAGIIGICFFLNKIFKKMLRFDSEYIPGIREIDRWRPGNNNYVWVVYSNCKLKAWAAMIHHYTAEVYPKISALVKIARRIDT